MNPDDPEDKISSAAAGCILGTFVLGCLMLVLGLLTALHWIF